MRTTDESSTATPRELGEAGTGSELDALRVTCWRQAQEIHSLRDTVAILRTGANRLAADNAFMHAELALTEPSPPPAEHRVIPGAKAPKRG